jgi:predicted metalloprotease
MSFNEDASLDTSQVGSGGGGGGAPGGMVVGGGIGGIILLIIMMIFGINPGQLPTDPGGGSIDQGQVEPGGSQDPNAFSQCKTGADANRDTTCRIIGTVNSVNAFWSQELPKYKREYTPAKTIIYNGSTQSACGTASNQVGPFYCPLDKQVYIDASFFQILEQQFGSSGGPLAQEYVVAHEYGHHIQDLLGLLDRAQQDPQGAESGSVRTELMADCLAGVWANHAATTKDANGTTYLKPLTESDIKSALSAASAVGDDRIQQKTQGRVNPESWTHGSAAERQKWFLTGYQKGDLNACDTFAATSLG